jgi:hypothetical protein
MHWSPKQNVYIKKCIECKEEFVGAKDEETSIRILYKFFSVGADSNPDSLHVVCRLCMNGRIHGYKLSHQQKKDLYLKQGGVCPICRKAVEYEQAHVDHDHETGVVRGLLHPQCNRYLEILKENWEGIARYLSI